MCFVYRIDSILDSFVAYEKFPLYLLLNVTLLDKEALITLTCISSNRMNTDIG